MDEPDLHRLLLLLCLTGLPLIFHHELDHLLDNAVDAPAMPAGMAHADLWVALATPVAVIVWCVGRAGRRA